MGWSANRVSHRLLQDVFEKLNLNQSERSRVSTLRDELDFRLITDDEIEWLGQVIVRHKGADYLHQLLGKFWEDRAGYKKDLWYLTRAASSWREAKQPQMALRCLQPGLDAKENRLLAAIHTCRAGALRDQGQLPLAETEARKATDLDDGAPHAYNVLGAIYYQKGDFESGDAYFRLAEMRGATGIELKKLFLSLNAEERQALAAHLLGKDSRKYAWVKPLATIGNDEAATRRG
jgi:tetratricopeptide (TPR) repeat protein